jgi:hypothetical protein
MAGGEDDYSDTGRKNGSLFKPKEKESGCMFFYE